MSFFFQVLVFFFFFVLFFCAVDGRVEISAIAIFLNGSFENFCSRNFYSGGRIISGYAAVSLKFLWWTLSGGLPCLCDVIFYRQLRCPS